MAHVRNFFQSPPAATGWSNFTVYDEGQLRLVQKGTLTPSYPYLFLLDSYIRPVEPTLPIAVVEIPRIPRHPYELGNRSGRFPEVLVHFFAQNRGARDDLAGFYADQLQDDGYIPVYEYTSGSSSTFLENAQLEDEVIVEEVSSRDEVRQEGSLDLWAMVSFGLRMKN